jgi:ribose 1,5-bisphosphokinase
MTARYALYFAPHADLEWWQFGSHWLGRCAATGRELPQPDIGGVERAVFAALTAEPRRYGFHATLKPPFRLSRGAQLPDLVLALDRLCSAQASFCLPPLEVAELGGFLALLPSSRAPRIEALAAACLRGMDRFRAPMSAAELARRRRSPLSAREDELLRRWGYPYVLDRFRFHFSLTGSLREAGPDVVAALRRTAAEAAARRAAEPLLVDSVCIFEEPASGADLRIVHRSRFAHHGRLVYMVGPSGAGKDSLLEWVRSRLPGAAGVRLARRTITRPADAGGESHLEATEEQFEDRLARGEFALHWRANGHRYGIGREIEAWLAAGATVVVNGSREHLPIARARFPHLEAVHVTAPEAVLQTRLERRGREKLGEAAGRLARNSHLSQAIHSAALLLVNDGPIEVAGERLAEFVAGGRG